MNPKRENTTRNKSTQNYTITYDFGCICTVLLYI